MAEAWLFWLALVVAVGLATVLTLAGLAPVGLFLAGLILWAARAAESPEARQETDTALRRAWDRLPICDCRPARRDA